MPNWAHSTLTVIGYCDELEKFTRAVEGETGFSFRSLLPVPKELEIPAHFREVESLASDASPEEREEWAQRQANIATHGCPDWYHWCIKNWGTKWDATRVFSTGAQQFAEGEALMAYVVYAFHTAWSPPVAFVEETSRRFPLLVFVLYYTIETGEHGRLAVIGGKMTVIEWDSHDYYFHAGLEKPVKRSRKETEASALRAERSPFRRAE